MADVGIDPAAGGYDDQADLGGAPDLGPLRAVAEQAELADAESGLTDGFGARLAADHPLAPLARDIARALVEAGLALHHCARHHRLYRLGGVCLLPVDRLDDDGGAGVVVSWTTHDLLSLDWARWGEYHGAQQAMNGAFGQVLGALGFVVRPFGSGGAWAVSGRRRGGEAAR